jgi:hypothetical protein
MQKRFLYSVSVILLIISFWVAVPIKSLHDCNNLNHSHDELCFEAEHEECNICDLSLQSSEPLSTELSAFYPSYSVELSCLYSFSFLPYSYSNLDNRGPPTHSNI